MTCISVPAATHPALPPDMPVEVRAAFARYAEPDQEQLLNLRDLIFAVAAETEGVGALEETLKWGQISYLTPRTKSGTTIRIDVAGDGSDQLALFVNCQTSLVGQYRALYGTVLAVEGNRCVRFNMSDQASIEALEHCIELALTYHLARKRKTSTRRA